MDLPISTSLKIVLLALLRYRNGQSGLCFPGIKLLGENTGLGKTATHEALRELELAGYVTVEEPGGGRGRRTNYVLNLPLKHAAGAAPECAPVNSSPGERFARPNGPANGSREEAKRFDSRKVQNNKGLNTYEHSLTRRHPPQRAGGRSRFARALAKIDRLVAGAGG